MRVAEIRCVLFDMGGVLVRFRGVERVAQWLGDDEVGAAHWRRWLGSRAVREFELGQLEPEEFAAVFLEEFDLTLTPDEVLEELHRFVSGPLEGSLQLLDSLRPHYLVACLSNTNRLHWPRMTGEMGFGGSFDHVFPSCETGLLKPDPEAFEQVTSKLGLAPGEILFFDDAPPNVDAALELGFQASRVCRPEDCRNELAHRGLWPAG